MSLLEHTYRGSGANKTNKKIFLEFFTIFFLFNRMLDEYEPVHLPLLKAQVSLQSGKVVSSDNAVSVSIIYSYMY